MENKTDKQGMVQEEQPAKKTKKFGWKTAGLVVLAAAGAFWFGKRGVKGVGQDIKNGCAYVSKGVKKVIPSKKNSESIPQAEVEAPQKFDNGDRRPDNRQNNWGRGDSRQKYNN